VVAVAIAALLGWLWWRSRERAEDDGAGHA
jgi:hypothetical protein